MVDGDGKVGESERETDRQTEKNRKRSFLVKEHESFLNIVIVL